MILLEVLVHLSEAAAGRNPAVDHLLGKLAKDIYDSLGVPSFINACDGRSKTKVKDIPSNRSRESVISVSVKRPRTS